MSQRHTGTSTTDYQTLSGQEIDKNAVTQSNRRSEMVNWLAILRAHAVVDGARQSKAEYHRLRAPGHGTGEMWSRRGAVRNAKRQLIPRAPRCEAQPGVLGFRDVAKWELWKRLGRGRGWCAEIPYPAGSPSWTPNHGQPRGMGRYPASPRLPNSAGDSRRQAPPTYLKLQARLTHLAYDRQQPNVRLGPPFAVRFMGTAPFMHLQLSQHPAPITQWTSPALASAFSRLFSVLSFSVNKA